MSVPTKEGAERILYKGRMIEIVEQDMLIGEKTKTFEFARRAPGTRLIIPKGDQLLLTREYRTEISDWDYRLAGGKVFDSLDEYNAFLQTGEDVMPQAMIAAKKEAVEEMGIIVDSLSHIATSHCGATIEWDLFYFVVDGFHNDSDGQHLELGEHIEVVEVPLEQVKAMCLDGSIKEDRSVAVLLRYLHGKGEV